MPKRRQATETPKESSTTSSGDSKSLTGAQKRAIVAAKRAKAKQVPIWKQPAIQFVAGILVALLFFVVSRPYWKAGLEAPAQTFKGQPVIQKPVSSVAPVSSEPLVYSVVTIPGKGNGMVAATDIKKGDLILKDSLMLRLPPLDEPNPTEYVSTQLSNFTGDQLMTLLSLSYAPADTPEKDRPMSIIQTNALSAGRSMAIFPNAARLNHACSKGFNAVYHWRDSDEQLYVIALRDIPEGEEILISYIDSKRPREERRQLLDAQYHFHCECSVCSLPDTESQASDARLQAMRVSYEKLQTWNNDTIDGEEAIKLVNSLWELYVEEDYQAELGQLAEDAALIATAHADGDSAHEWRLIAAQHFLYERGSDHQSVMANLHWAAKPSTHPAWAHKAGMTVGGPGPLAALPEDSFGEKVEELASDL